MTAEKQVSKVLAKWNTEERQPEGTFIYWYDGDLYIYRRWRTGNVINDKPVAFCPNKVSAKTAVNALNDEFLAITKMVKNTIK